MIEMYRYIQAETVNDDYILISDTKNRLYFFDIMFFILFGVLLLIQVLSYNHQDLGEFIFTNILLVIVVVVDCFRKTICRKTIKFNRIQGTIEFKRTIPKIDETFVFSKVEIVPKKIDFIDEDGYRFNHKSYLLLTKNPEIKYLVCKSGPNMSFDTFIKKYMKSDERTLSNLIHYKREDDEELKKVFHM